MKSLRDPEPLAMNEQILVTSFARAGLLGNPSDGYNGKAIAFIVRDFAATVGLAPAERIQIQPSAEELAGFESVEQMAILLEQRGFHDGKRLIKAAIKRFFDYCVQKGIPLHDRNFTISYETNIPRSVGLAGSSAIVTAALKALVRFYEAEIPDALLASMALSVEKDLLHISAGLMDRVIQMLEGVVFMDWSAGSTRVEDGLAMGGYESLTESPSGKELLENHLYVAYANRAAEPTEVLHNRLRERFDNGDPDVVNAMQQFAEFAEQGRQAIVTADLERLRELIDANFDLRSRICQLPKLHQQMVHVARTAGGSAKFCGSGGAIVGTFAEEADFNRIRSALNEMGCEVFQPTIF